MSSVSRKLWNQCASCNGGSDAALCGWCQKDLWVLLHLSIDISASGWIYTATKVTFG